MFVFLGTVITIVRYILYICSCFQIVRGYIFYISPNAVSLTSFSGWLGRVACAPDLIRKHLLPDVCSNSISRIMSVLPGDLFSDAC